MRNTYLDRILMIAVTFLVLFVITLLSPWMSLHGETITSKIAQAPLFVTQSVKPQIMLTMSNDHQLYFEAYPDYADLSGNGRPERTYNHEVDYYGYFDPEKCYDYTGNIFTPSSISETKYCSGNWSGNFLNWITMARIDVIRKILYGGYRYEDTNSTTVLERTYLPNDAHSWVKYYDGADISQLTPFSLPGLTSTIDSTSLLPIPIGSRNNPSDRLTFSTTWTEGADVQIGDQLHITMGSDTSTWMEGVVRTISGSSVEVQITSSSGYDEIQKNDWVITNNSRKGISFCNTTLSSTTWSQDTTDPPLIRIAIGNYSLWAAGERWQCRWYEEVSRHDHTGITIGDIKFRNGNISSISGVYANADEPKKAANILNADYIARVASCVSDELRGTEVCKEYPDGNLKPIGLLQQYGDDDSLEFGLVTGSYEKNKSGGVLRKNASSLTDEVNVGTDGTFLVPSGGSIINTLNLMRIYGYSHSDGTYGSASGDNCPYTLSTMSDGQCTNWGNPQSEMFLETLRYFSGAATATSGFVVSGNDKIPGLVSAPWTDPLSEANWCAPLSIIAINSSISSYDDDQLSGVTDIGASSITTLTDVVGQGEGIHGQSWFVGKSGSALNDRLCTPKAISSLGEASGLCPEAPSQAGTFHIAGLAHHAYTDSIRNDLVDSQNSTVSIQAKTYGVELAPAVPYINIPLPGQTATAVRILPACENSDKSGRCGLVDFKIVDQDLENPDIGTGKFLINWEAAEWGGDYDMDVNGILSYAITHNTITVTTEVFAQSSSMKVAFGYIISGTTQDGFHAHSGIRGYSYNDPTGVISCNGCTINDSPTSWEYTIGTSTAGLLRSPLYYASKWGGYYKKTRASDPTFPFDQKSWDRSGNNLPDNYYYAINPGQLAQDLSEIFTDIAATTSSAASVVANSVRLDTDTHIYQARFRTTDWSGELIAYSLKMDGTTDSTIWEAGVELGKKTPSLRNIYTYNTESNSTKGVAFQWSNLNDTQKAHLKKSEDEGSEALGQARLNYIRGDQSNEEGATGSTYNFRARETLLGDIVNSDPVFVAHPNFGYQSSNSGVTEGTDLICTTIDDVEECIDKYTKYRNEIASRPAMIYLGANDGMLHGFRADTGEELLAFIPNAVIPNLHKLTDPSYAHQYYVDGPARVGDAYINGQWRTILVGSTGAGGKSVFALDVTDPTTFSATNVLWEFTHADLGYTIGQPTIARLNTGTWVAIFGNGYESANHKAKLFVINLATGAMVLSEPINTGVGTSGSPNGLATPIPVDTTGNRITDVVYAGDLHGNLWKFNAPDTKNNTNDTNWEIAYSEGSGTNKLLKPLFTAMDGLSPASAQPITARPEVGRHPDGGQMVFFGTGKYFESTDNSVGSTSRQSFYGIWDNGSRIETLDRSSLVEQKITHQMQAFDRNLRVTTKNDVSYSGGKRGWYIDLVAPDEPIGGKYRGERVVSRPLLRHQRIIFTTLIPSEHDCDYGGVSWLMELSALTGERLNYSFADLNFDGLFNKDDYVEVEIEEDGEIVTVWVPISGIRSEEGITKTPAIIGAGDVEYKYFSGSSGEIEVLHERAGDDSGVGRQSWRQLR